LAHFSFCITFFWTLFMQLLIIALILLKALRLPRVPSRESPAPRPNELNEAQEQPAFEKTTEAIPCRRPAIC
jgi:hypothetical protein